MTLPFPITRPLVFFDLETTTPNPKTARIVEVAMIQYKPDGTVTPYSTLINPGISIPAEATAIHGITNDDVIGKPRWEDVAPKLMRAFRGADYGGYNVRFDLEVLGNECRRVEIDAELQVGDRAPRIVDPLAIWRVMEPRTLTDAYREFALKDLSEAHSAVADIEATIEVLNGQFARWSDLPLDLDKLDTLSFPKPAGSCVSDGKIGLGAQGFFLTFGQHAGIPLGKVDRSYIKWLLSTRLAPDSVKVLEAELAGRGK